MSIVKPDRPQTLPLMSSCPLTEDELSAYRKHPDTFFGVYKPQGRKAETPIELFDFFYEIYQKTPKEKLLEFLKDHSDSHKLQDESQEELSIIFCERMVYAAIENGSFANLYPKAHKTIS